MIFRQIIHNDLGCASYLIGDEKAGVAAVVDPRFEIDEYLELAAYMGVTIEHVFETHNHADHVSGHGRLAAATGARIHVHRLNRPEYEHEPFDDGDEFMIGALRLRVLHTPGHRPEHSCFLLTDTNRGDMPWALLSGDTLFVGDIARPDLAVEKHEGAQDIFESLRDKILSLPDQVEVWPGHLGGSMCGGPGMDMKVSSTVGYERTHNPMLQITDPDEFVSESLAKLGHQPPNFQAIVAINNGPLVTESSELPALDADAVEAHRRAGALLVDTRTDVEFDRAHIPGSVLIPIGRAGFGSKLAWVADREQDIVFIGRGDDDGRRAGRLARAIGLTRLAGFLQGGVDSWDFEARPAGRIERVPAADLERHVSGRRDLQIVDIREFDEFDECHIAGSICIPWHDISSLPDQLDPERPIAVVCASGARAATGASLLARHGAADVIHVAEGGVVTWRELGHPVESSETDVSTAA